MIYLLIFIPALMVSGITFNLVRNNQRRKNCVRVVVFSPDKRMRIYWAKPTGNNIKIDDKAFIIDSDYYFLYKGQLSLMYHTDSTNPIKIDSDGIKPLINKKEYDAETYATALNSKVVKEMIDSAKTTIDAGMIAMFLSGLSFLGIIFLWYTFSNNFQSITEQLDVIRRALGG